MTRENGYNDSASASEGLSVLKDKRRKANKPGDSKDQNEIQLSCNYCCLMVCAVLILLLNLVLVILSFVQSNRSLYYSIAGYENIDIKWFLVLFTLIGASFLSAAIIFLSFVARHPLELLNVAVIAGISAISYIALIPVWYILSTGPLNNLQSNMMESLEHNYKGETSWHLPSISWNYIQIFHQKCGVQSSEDWSESNWIVDETELSQSNHVPVYCCSQLDKDEISEEVLDHELTSEDLESLKSSCFGSNREASVQKARDRKVDNSEVGMQEVPVSSTEFLPPYSRTTSKIASLTASTAKNQDNWVVLGKNTTFEKATTEVTTSWTRPARKQREDVRRTSFKKVQIPQKSERVSPFGDIKHWRDVLGTIEATYYTPTHFHYNNAVRWYEALEYCLYYLPYRYPKKDFDSRPPGMAVGFSAQEVEFLISLPVFDSNSEAPHLGFYRPENKPYKSSMTVHAYRNITVPVNNYYSDFWKRRGNKYGCLHKYGRRDTCSNDYPMRYICARYLRVETRLPQEELPYIYLSYYQRHLTDTILGEYWILDIAESFAEAHYRCDAFFGPGFAVAVGYDQGELSFLAELIKLAKLSGSYFHLGFYRYYPQPYYYSLPPRVNGLEKNQVFFNVSFAHLWAPKNPGRASRSRPENFGCVDKKTRGHADSYAEREDKFVCALYDKIPEDPFNEKYRSSNTIRSILPDAPRSRKLPDVERATLGSGKITREKEGDSMFKRIYDWEDVFGSTKARFYIPRWRNSATWPDADRFCREVPLFDHDFDHSKHPPGLAVGWTTEELMMLKETFSDESSLLPHLGFHHEDVSDKSFKVPQYEVYVGKKSLTLGNNQDVYGGRFDRIKNYDMWADDQPQLRKGELYGCMIVERGAREDCYGTNTGSLICANYTLVEPTDPRPDTLLHKSEDHHFHVDRELPEMPPKLYYERYVNNRLFAQYFLVNRTFKRDMADNACHYTFGTGFGLAVGFDREEMEFLRKMAVEMYMRGPFLFLGYSREENQKYFTTQPYEIPIGTLWAKGQPRHRTKSGGGGGCMSTEGGYLSRAECEPGLKRSFACAVYTEIPHKVEYGNETDSAAASEQNLMEVDNLDENEADYATVSEQSLMEVEPHQATDSGSVNDEGCLAVVKSKIMMYSLPITGILVANCVLLIFIFAFSVITFCRSYLCYPGSIAA